MENTGSIPSVSSDTSALPAIDDGHLEGLEKGSAALLVLSGQQITLGRSDDSNIVLDDVTVSRVHALITKGASGWNIQDKGSLNGVYVNFVRIEDSKLSAGDDVQIGKYRFTFLLPEQKI
jgi:pSer/pThr/pTyr-binding forkhead associated (FHA) protein